MITRYNKGKLVNLILEQSLVPSHVLNQDMFQRALNKQLELLDNDEVSFKVQSDAANSLLTHLKPPANAKIELEVSNKNDGMLEDLNNTMRSLALKQAEIIDQGLMTAKDVAHQGILLEHRA